MAKVKRLKMAARAAYVLKETLDSHKPEDLRAARLFLRFMDSLGSKFDFTVLFDCHRKVAKQLDDARDARAAGTASDADQKLLSMHQHEYFAMLHSELDALQGVQEVDIPVEAGLFVVKWLEKQSFNMVGARLIAAFCDQFEDAVETLTDSK